MDVLLIVASGKSSRFGGFPKAFCDMGSMTNAENTAVKAQNYFEKVYIGVNSNTYNNFYGKISGCEMFSIVTGQGDAHSLLKCLMYIKEHESNVNRIAVCWGDAVFSDSAPFSEALEGAKGNKVSVACAWDEKPYAWFEVDSDNGIISSHFAKEEGFIEKGLHDQSLFIFDFDFVVKYLDEYRQSLGISNDNDESKSDVNEMKLLYSFEYLFEAGYGRAKCVEITQGKVLSFNTQEELEVIKKTIKL